MKRKPNILFVIADDHAPWAVGCLGNREVRTPTLDGIAAGGVSFTNAYILGGDSGAVCMPTRAAMHTGMSPRRACVDPTQQSAIRPESPLLFESLRRNGYHTHGIGKWHNSPASFHRSFESGSRIFMGGMGEQCSLRLADFDPTGEYPDSTRWTGNGFSTDLFRDAAIDFLDRYDEDHPFALYLALTSPHDPRTAPERYRALYPPEEITLRPNFLPVHPFDNGELHIRDEELAGFPRTPEEIRRHIADYYAMITSTDDAMRSLTDRLAARGFLENTIVIYTSDHGLAVGQHGLMGKQNVYEHSVKVPLLMTGPGIPQGSVVDSLIQSPDLHPSLCELAGVNVAAEVEVKSFRGLFRGEERHREHVGSYYRGQCTIRDIRFKLNCYFDLKSSVENVANRQLFDLSRDPWETENLATRDDATEPMRRLLPLMAEWRLSHGLGSVPI